MKADDLFMMTMAALDAGLHVLCEKPLARNAAHAKQLYERAEAQGVRHMTYFTWRWLPHYRYLHDLVAQIEFLYGGQATITVSAVARTHDPALEHAVVLHGEAGSLTMTFGLFTAPPKVQLATGDNGFQELAIPDEYLLGLDPAQPVGPQMGALFSQAGMGSRSFVDAILAGQTVAPSFYEGWQTQRVIDAAIVSHECGQWVDV